MRTIISSIVRSVSVGCLALATIHLWAGEPDSPQQTRARAGAMATGVYKARLQPHWLTNSSRFWYRNDLSAGRKEFILVDAEKGVRSPAFDHGKLAEALSRASGQSIDRERLPFTEMEWSTSGAGISFVISNALWHCDLDAWTCTLVPASDTRTNRSGVNNDSPSTSRTSSGPRHRERHSSDSPDGKWIAQIKDHNVFIRGADDQGETQLSRDGTEAAAYGSLEWSPDSKTLVAWRIEPGDRKEVFLIESSPPEGGRAILKRRPYALPGDKFAHYELNWFDVATGRQTKPDLDRFEHEWEHPELHWEQDPQRFTYQREERGHQRFRIAEVDTQTGAVRDILTEKSDTFIWTAHTEMLGLSLATWLEHTDELIYASERSGWRHLYLLDIKEGKIRNPITSGEWVVRGIDWIDETNRQVWFHASGVHSDQDPYFLQHYRVNFDGTGLVALTEGNGQHSVQFSPDRRYLIDTWSRVDDPPHHALRRTSDGSLVCPLEEADASELKQSGWLAPEVFVAKGRDGTTDIWGIICRPKDFDSARKYPVLESIYAGPQGAYVPKSFSGRRLFSSLTDLGFVVVQIDGMGTAFRSKRFHDVCWKNLKDAGFPDRILWHRAAAARYPWYDASRVGVFGTSAGGQNAAGAVLFHPELYRAAVANCGCHDNRMDKASWNEQWMGYPVGPQYAESSNIDNAHRLGGRLFLIVGELDTNVPPESTLRLVDALVKAGKDFELLVVPGAEHGVRGSAGEYVSRRTAEFFVRHLLGQPEPGRHPAESTVP